MQHEKIKQMITTYGTLYSESLRIRLKGRDDRELFKWFLASILMGKRIGEKIAIKTYLEFEKRAVLTPERILQSGWDVLVRILDEGGYVRYDFSTATMLLELAKKLKENYGGLNGLYESAFDVADIERKLQEFKGVGPVTTNIFLRELRVVWPKSDALVSPVIRGVASRLGIDLQKFKKDIDEFMRLECALFRVRKLSVNDLI